ncbi:MAG: alpha/beta hydrolase [Phenylobacterium sp.]|uniref:alpha/beta fold hydrolase n=1 Tax=Phenylobacterium sp. TaxID=1871053 RepID=UPI002733C782|nr:alpha/beta hydrolase [Phenylobacterium sp.]MDP3174811.1 alpha/beta hydrolase [Phenylobacterium sp.]
MAVAELTKDADLTPENTSRFVQTKKWRLHYNEAGTGHPIIMLHGAGPGASGWSNFNGNIRTLSKKYRVILMDFPGFNLSDELDPAKEPRWTANAEAVKLLMDELGIEKAALVGNSMGGMATMMFATLYNDRLSHLVTMGSPSPAGPPAFFAPGPGLSEGMKALVGAYHDPSPEGFRKLVNLMVYDDSFATDALIKQRSEAALGNPRHIANWVAGLRAHAQPHPDVEALGARLANVQTPALIMHGRDDRVVSVEHSLRTAAILPNSQLLVFNRCGHWAQVEHAKTFNGILDGFIASTLS